MSESFKSQFQQQLVSNVRRYQDALEKNVDLKPVGKLNRSIGLTLEASGFRAAIGTRCYVSSSNNELVESEVVGFDGNKTYLMCVGEPVGLVNGAKVYNTEKPADVPVGRSLLGRVVDGACRPLDDNGSIFAEDYYPINGSFINPLKREPIRTPLDVGVRAINSLFTVGNGQRLGLFASSGVGKSMLLSMMTRFTSASVIVVGLIGERGREVQEFIENNLGAEGLRRSVVVASPADQSPLMRLRGALTATTIAEFFRDRGSNVLLLMDSLTRYAQAQRELALSIGEPPASKGFPPSVFTKIPQLVERAGNGSKKGGSITAFYTVLTEGEDIYDPVAESARAILDGHIVLSRKIAESGHYPAIDVERSISRLMHVVTSEEHQKFVKVFRQLYAKYKQKEDLISIGAYQPGNDSELDTAINYMPAFIKFLQQGTNEASSYEESISQLRQLFVGRE